MLARQALRAAKKREVQVLERVCVDGLHKRDLFAKLVELAESLIFIKQCDLDAASDDSVRASFSSLPSNVDAPTMAILYTGFLLVV